METVFSAPELPSFAEKTMRPATSAVSATAAVERAVESAGSAELDDQGF